VRFGQSISALLAERIPWTLAFVGSAGFRLLHWVNVGSFLEERIRYPEVVE
jgi:hypothetical protein